VALMLRQPTMVADVGSPSFLFCFAVMSSSSVFFVSSVLASVSMASWRCCLC